MFPVPLSTTRLGFIKFSYIYSLYIMYLEISAKEMFAVSAAVSWSVLHGVAAVYAKNRLKLILTGLNLWSNAHTPPWKHAYIILTPLNPTFI